MVVASIAMGAVAMGTMVPPMATIAGSWVIVVTFSVAVSGAVSQGQVLSRNPSIISCGIRGKPDSHATSANSSNSWAMLLRCSAVSGPVVDDR